jgi:hypothetical protein
MKDNPPREVRGERMDVAVACLLWSVVGAGLWVVAIMGVLWLFA